MGLNTLANPSGEIRFGQGARSKLKHVHHAICIGGEQFRTIDCQKQLNRHKGGALVAIKKRMVAGNAKTITCGEFSHIGRAAMRKLLGAGQCRCQGVAIAKPWLPTVFSQLLFVNGMDDLRRYPGPNWFGRAHLANS